jgi:2-polyprenyl-3-methyl-5-hydroxy-6-metoxy-1,4-benzoquinol methylase
MSLPQETVDYLKAWMMSPEHISHPYLREQEKAEIMAETGIELKQLMKWFANNRKRYWKPRVEAKLQMNYYMRNAFMIVFCSCILYFVLV